MDMMVNIPIDRVGQKFLGGGPVVPAFAVGT